jgi:hypothetical protein
MSDPAIVFGGEDHGRGVVDRAVRLEDEERAIEQERAVATQLRAGRAFRNTCVAPACVGVFEERVEVRGDYRRIRSLDDGAMCGFGRIR